MSGWARLPDGQAQEEAGASADQLRKPFGDVRARRHWARSRTYDLKHVKVELGVNWDKREIAGTATLTLAPINDGLLSVEVDAVEMSIEEVRLEGGPRLDFSHDGQRLTIVLDHAYASGENLRLAIRYRARPRKGLYFTGPDEAYPDKRREIWTQGESQDTRYWVPLYDFPNDKATSELVVRVPADMLAISNGRLVEVGEDPAQPGTKTYHWREEVPHSTYLISLIVGRFDHHSEQRDGLPVDYYVPPGTAPASVERSFAQTPAMIRFFGDTIGVPYPYEKYAQTTVQGALFGGMENVSASTLYADTLHDEAAAPNWTSEGLVAHELVHQWWGDLLTCRDWSHIWLNEGFATFFTNLWFEQRYGREEYDYRRWQNAERYFCEDNRSYRPSCLNDQDYRRPIVWGVYVHEMDLFDAHSYPKGALVLDMLRSVLGPALFQKAIRHYGKKFARQAVTTEDFRQAIAEATGQELGWFFEEWLYRAGHPEFSVRWEWDAETHLVHLVVEQKQERTEMTPLFRLPVEVEFTTGQGAQTFRLQVAHPRDDFYFPLPERPTRVRFDPDQRILKTLEFPQSRPALIDLLQNDPNVIGRIWAAEQLGGRGSDLVALGVLRESLLNDPFYGVRAQVARVLGETKSAAARDALIEGLRDPDARVREKVAKALGQFQGDARAAQALENVVAQEAKSYVVAAAVKALGGTRAEKAFEQLRAALARPSHREVIRRAVFEGLGALDDARGLKLAQKWSRYGRPPRAREAAIQALGKLGRHKKDEVLDHLLALLNDPYIWARRAALKALGKLGDARALPALEAFAASEIERRLQRDAEVAVDKIRRTRAAQGNREELESEVNTLKQEVRQLREKLAAPPPR
ncbi:MAG: M1 family aminopeptidase [Terriglobia bacterium]